MSLASRISKLKDLIKIENIDALFICSNANISYLSNYSNFSNEEHEGFLLITPNESFIFTAGRYLEAVGKSCTQFKLQEISKQNPLPKTLQQICQSLKLNKDS